MARFKIKPLLVSTLCCVLLLLILFYHQPEQNETQKKTEKASSPRVFDINKPLKTENDKLDAMMFKNMLKAEEKQRNQLTEEEFNKLPIPEEIIKIAKGPVPKQVSKMNFMQKFEFLLKNMHCSKMKKDSSVSKDIIILLGRDGSGIDLLAKWIHSAHGIFILQGNNLSAKEVLYSVTNLSNCVAIHPIYDNMILSNSTLKFNNLMMDACDENCLNIPSLWREVCQNLPHKAFVLLNTNISDYSQMFENNHNLKPFYIYRDPRAMLTPVANDKDLEENAFALCESLNDDLKEIFNDKNLPKKNNFQPLRFEDFALRPSEVVLDQIGKMSEFCPKEDKIVQNLKKEVYSWKLKFSMEQLNSIEDKCNQVLNRLEYPIYGSNVLT